MTKVKANNHILPRFILNYWKKEGAKVFVKSTKNTRELKYLDFSKKYYYSLGTKDDALENRISKIEQALGIIIKKVNEAKKEIILTGKEIELLKLFVVLSACRQHNTSPFIVDDESGLYINNKYLFGVPFIDSQEKAVAITTLICDEFDRLQLLDDDAVFSNTTHITLKEVLNCRLSLRQHLVISETPDNKNIVSDRCAIIECDLDSHYLYTYVPISPTKALLLVNSEYFFDKKTYDYTRGFFGRKFGNGYPDPFISDIFKGYDSLLFCSYNKKKLSVTTTEQYIDINSYSSVKLEMIKLPKVCYASFNCVFAEDGKRIVFCDKDELDFSLKTKLHNRHITLSW
jgi:hypothetical protein